MPKCSLPDKSIILIGFALEIHISLRGCIKPLAYLTLRKLKAFFLVYLLAVYFTVCFTK